MRNRVMIVDDEPKLVNLIRMLGHWDELGFEIIATASDGQQALELILELQPDLVVSDIKMPGMDGIELIDHARKAGSNAFFILLSGYRHFEYARSAISLNVVDYLLKPISEEQLNVTLEKVSMQIASMRQHDASNDEYLKLKQAQTDVLSQEFWSEIIYPTMDGAYRRHFNDEQSCDDRFHFGFDAQNYLIVLVCADVAGGLENPLSLFSHEVERLIRHYLEPHADVRYDMMHAGCNILCNFESGKETILKEAISALYYALRDLQEIYGDFSLNIGISECKHSCKDLKKAFLEARAAEWGKFVIMQNSVLRHEQVAEFKRINYNSILSNEEIARIKNCIRYLRPEEMGEIFRELNQRFARLSNIYPGCVNEAYYRLIDSVDEAVKSEKVKEVHEQCDLAVNTSRSYMELIRQTFVTYESYIESELAGLHMKSRKPITDAVRFIGEHYAEALSQEIVAEHSNVSTSYLSRMFKEEMGVGFQEYLTDIRIKEAEKLLAASNLSIKEIAMSVGYPDEKYFSRLYKRLTGIKPSEYRRIYG